MTRSRGWPDLWNDSSMPSYKASATPIRVNPSTATVAPSGMAATASRTEASRKISQHVPAADVDDFTGDVACLVRGQERDQRGDVGGLPHAAPWNLRHLLLADRVRDGAGHLRVNESGADRIHGDLGAG